MDPTLAVLYQRRAALDAELTAADRFAAVDPDVARFIAEISWITPPGNPRNHPPRVPADAADEIMKESELLRRLGDKAPGVTDGPLPSSAQLWVATGRGSPRANLLDPSHFIDSDRASGGLASTKPFEFGLYTSSGQLGDFGMWWCYLELNRGSSLFPLPWRVWSLEVDSQARVLEISTAMAWVEFVAAKPVRKYGLLYPDWKLAGARWDGVHMTLRAIAATQGVAFCAGNDVVAPPYWDVESTLWLRWSFTSAEEKSIS